MRLAPAFFLALVGCTPQQQATLAVVQPELVRTCDAAMLLAPVAGPAAPWIIGGCGTAEGLLKLAADPSSLAWVNGLIAKVKGAPTSLL